MLELLTTDHFARWFAALDDARAEDVATALDVIERIGPHRAAPGSRESLLWYEHPSVAEIRVGSLAWELEAWGEFRDYVKQIEDVLEAPRFLSRVARLPASKADEVLASIKRIKRAVDPRRRWALKLRGDQQAGVGNSRDEVRALYFAALEAAGFDVIDVPAHSLALRELSRRCAAHSFRLLYGVDARRTRALVVLGEHLDRSFYGDSVRRAESMWKRFLEGELVARSSR